MKSGVQNLAWKSDGKVGKITRLVFKPWIFKKIMERFEQNIFYSGKSQKKNMVSYFGLIDGRMGPSHKE